MQAVLAALPGGDPLRDAVEAGETPSPALVAARGEAGDLHARHAWLLLAGVVVALLLTATIDNHWLLPVRVGVASGVTKAEVTVVPVSFD